ncbi:MAG: MFS transporter [Pelagibacterales bacterium MED-G42]|nr:MAG: MFS transporter [Pelagibacterales bacterium MED-G42]|tara:strand:+ start:1229 stop:2410 length:1182 start_codon:yes stop_codon:yes gene_type:complete
MLNKNLVILSLSQIFSFTAAPITVFLSGIIGSQISPIKSLSTLPMSISVVGIAVGAIFATKLMSLIGRKAGFIFASLGNSLVSLLAAYSIMEQNFILFCFANFFLGVGMAFTHQYRFAAAESVEKDKIPKAISIILLGGIISAFIGPGIANYSKDIVSDQLYVGSYISLSILMFIPAILFLFYENILKLKTEIKYSGRSYLELISQPKFLQAMIASAFGYAIMTFLMTATPLSMHVMEKMSLDKTSMVIQFHVASMFLPSLLTGHLIKKIGHSLVMYAGIFLYCITILISFFDQTYMNYMFALIFLGLGWNFLFISGTSLLVLTYKEEEKFKAQGLNDFIVYSIHATGSLSAGILIVLTNWKFMNMMCIPLLIIIVLTILRADIHSKKLIKNN